MKNVTKSETYWFETIHLSNAKGNLFFIFLKKVREDIGYIGIRNSYNVAIFDYRYFIESY